MRRILTTAAMLVCSLLTFAQFSGTVSDSQGVRYTANDDESTCYVSGHEVDYNATIVIPEMIEGRSVTSIGDYAFEVCSGLTSLTIPTSVTSIGDYAFEDCSGLTSLTIPASVTSIGSSPFHGCSGMTSIIVENGNTVYDSRDNCNAIIRTSDNTLIEGCKNTVIPTSVTSIGDFAFEECSGLTSLTIPASVTSIGYGAFSACSGLTSLTIPASVTSIGELAFLLCSGLTSIIVENGNTIYDSRDNCNAIIRTSDNMLITGSNNSVIPASVTSIGDFAFSDCSGLTSLTIPASVTSIGYNAFSGCSGLTSLTIPEGVTSIGDCAFSRCSSLTLLTIPASVTSIGGSAFSGCSGLTSLTIPEGVTSIGSSAFSGCSGLTSIIVENGNMVYDSRDNCNAIVKTSDNTLIAGCKNTVIPEGVTSIDIAAFSHCSGLTSLTIPEGVTSIDIAAFSHCSGLTSLTIPASVTSIGGSAFSGCSGLMSLTIPASVTVIGGWAFEDCSGLISMIVGWDTPLTLNNSHFRNVDLSKVTLYVPKGTKEAYEAADVWKDFGTIIEYEKDNVLNEEDTTVPPSAIDVNVKVMRTINANEWSTICLPFAMTTEQVTAAFGDDVKIGDFDGYETTEGDGDVVLAISMKFKQVTAMEANHPYVIKVSSKITEFSVEGVDLMPVENPVWAKTSGEMVGTYVAETVIPSGSMFLSGNKFWYSVGNSKMKAFRAYFHLNDMLPDLNGLEPAARVYLAFEDETTEIDATLIKSNEEPDNIGWHTLDGRKLAKMPTKKGVYVANGRKVVIK